MHETLTYGEGIPTFENHSKDFACTSPECCKKLPDNKVEQHTVGIKKAPFTTFSGLEYARMIECPDCFQVYWYHIPEAEAKAIKLLQESQKNQ